MTFNQPNRDQYRGRLRETIRWCTARHPIRDPQRDLRTPDLKPVVGDWPSFEELDAALSVLAKKRRERIDPNAKAEGDRGRVLVCEYNASITSGESEDETSGFFDVADRPPWDTWMFCVQRTAAASGPGQEPVDLLISWVPSSPVAAVETGIRVNPYDCIYWASEIDLAEWGLGS